MSRTLADQLVIHVTGIQSPVPPTFVLANGRTASAVSQVLLRCAFRRAISDNGLMDCVFYVFQTLSVPMIMGLEFLYATETLTRHRDRLVEQLVPSMQALRVCSVGRPKRDVVCRVGNHVGCATADTGSDLDLVSPDFAASRAFDVEGLCVEFEFADGSTGYTIGMIKTSFCIGRVSDVEGFVPKSKEVSLELFLLNNLNADILLGTDTTQDLQAFSGHEDCFIPAMSSLGQSELNILRYIGAVERGFSREWGLLKDSFTSTENKQAARTSMSSMPMIRMQPPSSQLTLYSDRDHQRKPLHQDEQLLHDQLSNRTRQRPTERTPREGLSCNEPVPPSTREQLAHGSITLPLTSPPVILNEPPEQPRSPTSPSTTDSLGARPYFCPVKDCRRGEGGHGFKLQSEMTRHRMVHKFLDTSARPAWIESAGTRPGLFPPAPGT